MQLKTKYPNDPLTLQCKVQAGEIDSLPTLPAIDEETNRLEMPDTYALFENYPNPFNPITTIDYQMPKNGFITIKIYDVLGREVVTLVNEIKNVGRYSATFNANQFSSGVYFCRFISKPIDGNKKDIFTAVKKMLLLK